MKMDHCWSAIALTFCLLLPVAGHAQEDADREASVIAAVQSYVDAFNKKDAFAVSQHWASNGEMMNAEGESIKGRDSIQKAFEARFAEMEGEASLAVTVNRISFVTDEVAIEEGTATVDGEKSNYTAVHRKENGIWRLHTIRETSVEATKPANTELKKLAWLVGEWVDESDDAIVRTSVRWSKNENFLISNFNVQMPEMEALQGTQVIGFDRSKNTIRSWTFDSSGGFTQAIWSQKGNRWTIKAKRVMTDGQILSSTNIFSVNNENEYSWRSIDRKIGEEDQPDVGPVTVHKLKEESE